MTPLIHLLALLCICLAFLPANLVAQPFQQYVPDVYHYGIREGLKHRHIHCTFQDQEGFIWVGTHRGLNRYDGHEFTVVASTPEGVDPQPVHQIQQDDRACLWLMTYKPPTLNLGATHVYLYDTKTGAVETLEQRFGDAISFSATDVARLFTLPDGTLIIGLNNGTIVRYNSNHGFVEQHIENAQAIFPIHYSTEGNLLIRQSPDTEAKSYIEVNEAGEVVRSFPAVSFHPLGGRPEDRPLFYHATRFAPNESESPIRPITFYQHRQDSLPMQITLPGTPSHGWFFGAWYTALWYDEHSDAVWFHTPKTLFMTSVNEELSYDFEERFNGLIRSQIGNINFDKSGNAWCATADGLYKIRMVKSPFKRLLYTPKRTAGLLDFHECRKMQQIGNTLYVNTQKEGIFEVNLETGNTRKRHWTWAKRITTEPYEEAPISSLVLADGHLLTGDQSLTLHSNTDTTWRNIHFAGRASYVWGLHEARNGRIWAGCDYGSLAHWDRHEDTLRIFKHWNNFQPSTIATVYDFLELNSDSMLVASSEGVFLIEGAKGVTQRWWRNSDANNRLMSDNVYHMYLDADGIIWLATGGGGLTKWTLGRNGAAQQFDQYNDRDGLPNNTLYAVYEDGHQNLWMPSDAGIIRWNKATQATTLYGVQDGITHREFNRSSHYRGHDSTLYFGGLNGVTAFHPNDVQQAEAFEKPLVVTRYTRFDGESQRLTDDTHELKSAGEIVLQPGDNFFTLQFALLDFRSNDRIQYSYKIEGQDPGWNRLQTNSLRISGLAYGEYTLQVRALGATGQYTRENLEIPIRVLRPFYLKPWFLIAMALLVLIAIVGFFQGRTRQLQKRKRELQEQVTERTATIEEQKVGLERMDRLNKQIFSVISHDFHGPLMSMGLMAQTLGSRELSARQMEAYVRDLNNQVGQTSRVLDTLLDWAKAELKVDFDKRQQADAHAIAHEIIAHLDHLAQPKNITVVNGIATGTEVPMHGHILRIAIRNMVSNAIKYSHEEEEVVIGTTPQGGLFVKDTGIGIAPDLLQSIGEQTVLSETGTASETGFGLGLYMTQELVRKSGWEMLIESEVGKGTRFSINPIVNGH